MLLIYYFGYMRVVSEVPLVFFYYGSLGQGLNVEVAPTVNPNYTFRNWGMLAEWAHRLRAHILSQDSNYYQISISCPL